MNKQELESSHSSLNLENTKLHQALNAIVNGRVQQIHTYQETEVEGGSKYIWTVADLDRAHGGLFMQTFRYEGQSDMLSVYYLDDMRSDCYGYPVANAMSEAVSKARSLRGRMMSESAV